MGLFILTETRYVCRMRSAPSDARPGELTGEQRGLCPPQVQGQEDLRQGRRGPQGRGVHCRLAEAQEVPEV
jgi:hypothetical protein